MSSSVLLDDINQSTVYIPYEPDDTQLKTLSSDILDGPELRLAAYKKAWAKCLGRVQSIIHEIQAPVAAQIIDAVQNAHSQVLYGLPYPEIPVICVTAPSTGPSFFQDVTIRLGQEADSQSFVVSIFPAECTSIMNGMKALITGFVDQVFEDDEDQIRRKPTTSLATHDIELLVAWFTAKKETTDVPISLVVIMQEFEQWDALVVQDMLYICSLHITKLPLVFVLSMSSPPSPSFLRATYPQATLALLRVRSYTVPSGPQVLESVLERTFFDVEFEPDLVLGPSTMDFLCQHFSRINTGMDSVLTILQLAHMKHFEEPLTVFSVNSLLGTSSPSQASKKLVESTSLGFLENLALRIFEEPHEDDENSWAGLKPRYLLDQVDSNREEFKARAREMRIAFGLLDVVQSVFIERGMKHTDSPRSSLEGMREAVRGRLGTETYLLQTIRVISEVVLVLVLEAMLDYFNNMPESLCDTVADAVDTTEALRDGLADGQERQRIADQTADWLTSYFQTHLQVPLHELDLADIWSTGGTPFPAELINPSIRASVLSGLKYPHDYSSFLSGAEHTGPKGLSHLPDTSILFRRYLDSGKIINVYDWFDAFLIVLETQRKRKQNLELNGKGKGKATEEDEEGWNLEVQARFMRALHELDYLGLIKHTGRKADHVLRTVFDQPD